MHARHTEKTLMPVKLHIMPMNLLLLQHASSFVSARTFFADVFTCNCVRVTCYGWMMAKPYYNTITNWSIIFKTHESPCQRGRDNKSVQKVIIVHVFAFPWHWYSSLPSSVLFEAIFCFLFFIFIIIFALFVCSNQCDLLQEFGMEGLGKIYK